MFSLAALPLPGGWSNRQVTIGSFTFGILTPADPDAVLGEIETPHASHQPHLADPYWSKLWPAAPLLAAALVRHPPPKGTRVLELGCGSGLVGLTALALDLDVTFSDYVPLAVELALENAARNQLPKANSLILDWHDRSQKITDQFLLILAADVTYDRTNLDALLAVLSERVAPGGQAWFGDAGRSPALEFISRAKTRGWHVQCFDEHDEQSAEFRLGQFVRIVLTR
jgi:predicted nicotinamide N-methyase